MARFSDRMVPEVVQGFWAAMARGEFVTVAAAEAGTHREKGTRWLAAEGGIRPRRGRDLKGRCLTFSEREEIALARAGGESMRSIARRLGRSPSTVSRELARNCDRAGGDRATTAAARACVRASRPKPSKLVTNLELRRKVEEDLRRRYSPRAGLAQRRAQWPICIGGGGAGAATACRLLSGGMVRGAHCRLTPGAGATTSWPLCCSTGSVRASPGTRFLRTRARCWR
jgi:DNA-binding CsgD family transcriptional regulator